MKTLTLRIPDELHLESNEVLEQIGLDVPTAFRLFLTQVAATRSIPFTLTLDRQTAATSVAVPGRLGGRQTAFEAEDRILKLQEVFLPLQSFALAKSSKL